MSAPIIESTNMPCRIPTCTGNIVKRYEMKSSRRSYEAPRYGGPPSPMYKSLASTYCDVCGVRYEFANNLGTVK